ncbi:MAG: RusA family crossover junction endodeoxyribonuclease [Actinobacteria bacterium]|nr:RusA family crossover junction endodeoxyribonuclease [Actinomycetota bacterium]MCG2803424.1 RusA family crossover junction endodeoxyribonuclease [Cellulomonas sp.]
MSKYRHPLDVELTRLGSGASNSERLEALWAAYERETKKSLGRPPSDEDRQAVRSWAATWRDEAPTLLGRWPSLQAALYGDVRQKASFLTQRGCGLCHVDADATPLAVYFAIPIEPWSSQSRSDRRVIRDSVMKHLAEKSLTKMPWGDRPICATVASVISVRGRRKDADNLVKGLLDAMQGFLYSNDGQIQCLTSRRFEYAGSRGYYLVAARPVLPVTEDVIFDDPAPPPFA